MLSQKHLTTICLMNQGDHKTCRFLYQDDLDYHKWYCAKLHTSKRARIDNAVSQFVEDCGTKSIDPKSKGRPLGDNCPGFPILKHVMQGES